MILSKFKLPRYLVRSLIISGVMILLFVSLSGAGNDYRSIFLGLPSALIVLGGTSVQIQRRGKLELLGDISYSLYLAQSLILWWLIQLAIKIDQVNVRMIFF